MSTQQKADEFWIKLIKAVVEIQNEFRQLDLREKKIVAERINKVFQMQGITISIDALLNLMENSGIR